MAQDGAILKEARKKAGLSQAALAEAAECVTATDISKAERGIKELTSEQLKAVAKVLKVKPEALQTAEEEPVKAAPEALTTDEQELLDLFRAADDETQSAAVTVLKGEVPQNPSFIEKLVGMLGALGGDSDDPKAALMGMLSNGGGEKIMSALMGIISSASEKKEK